jgi:hypothetical protein
MLFLETQSPRKNTVLMVSGNNYQCRNITIYYHIGLGIIHRCHGNITILSWYSSNYYQTAWEYYCIITGILLYYHGNTGKIPQRSGREYQKDIEQFE